MTPRRGCGPLTAPRARSFRATPVQSPARCSLADGRILTWSWDNTARLWAADGTPGPVLKGYGGPVIGALQLADGRLLTRSSDSTARLWAAERPGTHPAGPHGFALRRRAACRRPPAYQSSDNTARLWPLERSLLAWADEYIGRLYPLTPAEACSYYLERDETCTALSAPAKPY